MGRRSEKPLPVRRCVLDGRVLYRYVVRPLLYLLSAETAHHLAITGLKIAQWVPGGVSLLKWMFAPTHAKPVEALGLTFPSAIGLAAGFDKDAEVYRALGALGFGFIEVGTITAQGQPGNPRPRLFRLPLDRALINRMGFNNRGAKDAARRLRMRNRSLGPILGINIGKTKIVPPDEAPNDYEASTRLLAPHADYFVVNVSSPNTPGLRDLQAVSSLRPILEVVRRALDETVKARKVPLLVKIAPDLADEDIVAVAALAKDLALDGIVATNTTISRAGLSTDSMEVQALGAGGLSGAPIKERALHVIQLLRKETGPEMVLIAAGGIESAEDARKRLAAGADLVQIYSALVFDGPRLPGRISSSLAR